MGEDPLGEMIAMRNADRYGNQPLRGPADPERVKRILDAAPDNRDPVARCPKCRITVLKSSDAKDDFCSSCGPAARRG